MIAALRAAFSFYTRNKRFERALPLDSTNDYDLLRKWRFH